AEYLLRPQVAVEVELEERHLAGGLVYPELEATVVERAILGEQLRRVFRDLSRDLLVLERVERILGAAVHQVALLVISAQVAGVGLAEDHLRQDHRLADRDHRDLDVAADNEWL